TGFFHRDYTSLFLNPSPPQVVATVSRGVLPTLRRTSAFWRRQFNSVQATMFSATYPSLSPRVCVQLRPIQLTFPPKGKPEQPRSFLESWRWSSHWRAAQIQERTARRCPVCSGLRECRICPCTSFGFAPASIIQVALEVRQAAPVNKAEAEFPVLRLYVS